MSRYSRVICLLIAGLLAVAVRGLAQEPKTITVAADGSGDFKTVQTAIDSIPSGNSSRVIIHIKPGTYKEVIRVPKDRPLVTLKGDDARTTVLTDDWNAKHVGPEGKEVGTGGSASVRVNAHDFTAEDITFSNTAGDTGQAVALSVDGDREIFRRCRLLGWQDTLYANGGRQFFDHCYIEGRVDFIFGNALAVFDHCEIHSKNGGHITAASTAQDRPWGYVFLYCNLTGDAIPLDPKGKVTPLADLGRPWRPYASVTYVRCNLGSHISPKGWSQWRKGDDTDKTARYAEYKCTGPGADRSARVPWSRELTDQQAAQLTVSNLLAGDDHWGPATRIAK